MKVLLTGANGFIGHYVLKALEHHGTAMVAVGRTRPQASIPFIEADLLKINDFAPLVQKAQATHLLHLAWYAEHGKYWTSPLNLRWTEATARFVETFCIFGGQRVVIAGTCAEYDWTHGYCREDSTPLNPATLYGTAKDAARRLVMAVCAQHKVPCAWGRIFLPFGLGESVSRLIPSLVEVFRGARAPFSVNTQVYRDFLHASDVAEGFVRLLLQSDTDTYNICSSEPTRLAEVVKTLASIMDADPAPVLALTAKRSGDPLLLVGENLKLKALGWRPALTLAQGLEQTLHGKNE